MSRQAMSLRAAARRFGVGRDRLVRAVRAGELPAYRLGARRLSLFAADVERWIRGQPADRAEGAIEARARKLHDSIRTAEQRRRQ